nr:reverse transcriptase domain-containing protein [Tanacetum cinerariifolium]
MSTRSSARNLFPPLDNPELTIRRRPRVDPTLLNDFEISTNGNGDDVPPPRGGDLPVFDLRTMEELCQPTLNGWGGPIAPISIQATNFGLKNNMIQQVQNSCQFHGLPGDDANKHLDKFLHVTQSGTFMKRRPEECYDLIKNMTAHHNDWDTFVQRSESSSCITSSFDPEIVALKAEMVEINKNLMKVLQINQQVKAVAHNCETCGGPHSYNDYPATFGQTQNMNTASSSGSGTLPSNTITNPKEDLKGITTRSGNAYKGPTIPTTSSPPKVIERETEVTKDTPIVAPVSASKPNLKSSIPYPSRLHDQKLSDKTNDQKEKFFQIFQDLNFNISFADALILIPKFGPTIKSLLTNKDKLFELARTPLNEHCSEVLLKKLREKLRDPSKFLILCDFSGMDECLALSDLNASINLMPLSMWNKLSLPELSPTCMTLEIMDRSISRLVRVAEDVVVKVGTFHFPADFVVIDFDADPRVLLILGRSFLKIGRALIDVYKGELTLRVNRIDLIDVDCEEYSQEILGFSMSGNPTPSTEPIVSISSPTLTPFGDSDFLLEDTDAFLAIDDEPISLEIDESYYDSEGDILLLEEFLNDDSSSPHVPPQELKGDDKLPIIIAKDLKDEEKTALIKVLKSHKQALAWKLSDIKEKTKRIHDSKIKDRVFNVGDRVLLFNSRLKIFSGKLKTRWSGPFVITQVFPYGTIELSQTDGPNFKVNGHRLKHHFGEHIPKMVVPDLQTFPKDCVRTRQYLSMGDFGNGYQQKDKIKAKPDKTEYEMESVKKSKVNQVKNRAKAEELLNGPTRTHLIGRNGPTPHPQTTDPAPKGGAVPQPRNKRDEGFTEEDNRNELADIQAINILSQGLPIRSGQTLERQKEALFDEFECFRANGNELIQDYFVRFHNDSHNDAMLATMNQIANLLSGLQKQFPPTNNQLRTSSNPKTHATVHDGQIVTKMVQRRALGNMGTKGIQTTGLSVNNSGKKVICYNCRREGHVARQCKEPKRARDSQWYHDKALLMQAKEKGVVLDAKAEAFLTDVEYVDEGPHASAAFMANLSFTGGTNGSSSSHINEEEQLNSEVDSVLDDNMITYDEYQNDSRVEAVPTVVSADKANKQSMIAVLQRMHTEIAGYVRVNDEHKLVNATLTAELERCKIEMQALERNKVKHDLDMAIVKRNKQNAELEEENVMLKSTLKSKVVSIENLQPESKHVLSKKKTLEDKYLKEIAVLTNANKVATNVSKGFQMPTHTIPMLSKRPNFASHDLHKTGLGYSNPRYGKQARIAQPALYDGHVLPNPNHPPTRVHDSKESLVHAEVCKIKMAERPRHALPINYAKLNALRDDSIRNLQAQNDIMSLLNVGSTDDRCNKQALETELAQLKDTVTSLKIQNDRYKVTNANLNRCYEELSKSNTHFRTTSLEKIAAQKAKIATLNAKTVGNKTSGTTKPANPKVIASRMYAISPKYIVPQRRTNRETLILLPKKKQVTFQETPKPSPRFTKKPVAPLLKKPNVNVPLSSGIKSATRASKPASKSNAWIYRKLPAKSTKGEKVEEHIGI